ncbi:nicotinate-nucleotide adenylyltransferase [Blattabacterium sp. (Nauphoeta cinerea)]|nr:nicotinate-nucleotide adenylyltransferase [Blattabacterium sp. (Nauphoeta cinerea)]
MVKRAIFDYKKMNLLDIEYGHFPSYTIHTLDNIEKKYPINKFSILLGKDSFSSLRKWKNYKIILNKYEILVYPRVGSFSDLKYKKDNIIFLKAPIIEISSSFIRKSIQEGKNIKSMLSIKVWDYIKKYKFYMEK